MPDCLSRYPIEVKAFVNLPARRRCRTVEAPSRSGEVRRSKWRRADTSFTHYATDDRRELTLYQERRSAS